MQEDHVIDEIENPLLLENLAKINHYIISNTPDGILEIKLAGSSKKFLFIAIPLFIFNTAFLVYFLLKDNFETFFLVLLGLIIFCWLGLKILFTLIRKVKWHFTETELIIFNNARRKIIIPKTKIEYLTIEHLVTGTNSQDFDQTFWIILKTKDEIYEDGKLYLLKIEGDSLRKNLEERYETEDVANPLVESMRIADIISRHWSIPIHETES